MSIWSTRTVTSVNGQTGDVTVDGGEGVAPFADGSVAAPSINFEDETDSGLYREEEGKISVAIKGQKRLHIGEDDIEAKAPCILPSVALPATGSASNALLNYGTAGTGIFGNATTLSATTDGTRRLLIDNDGITVTGGITGSLTGAASLNVLKGGDTMTGVLRLPSTGANNNPMFKFTTNAANTGMYGDQNQIGTTINGTYRTLVDSTGLTVNGTITGSLTGNVTGNVSGSAGLNVLKAGDTMSGPLVFSHAGSATDSSITFGSATTGIFGGIITPAVNHEVRVSVEGVERVSFNNLGMRMVSGALRCISGTATNTGLNFGTTSVGVGGNTTSAFFKVGSVAIATATANGLQITPTATINDTNTALNYGTPGTGYYGDGTTLSASIAGTRRLLINTSGINVTGVTTGTFSGPLTGNVTGNVTGSASLNVPLTGGAMTGALTLTSSGGNAADFLRVNNLAGTSLLAVNTLTGTTAVNGNLAVTTGGVSVTTGNVTVTNPTGNVGVSVSNFASNCFFDMGCNNDALVGYRYNTPLITEKANFAYRANAGFQFRARVLGSENLADNLFLEILNTGNVNIQQFTKLGSDAPSIKMKKFTGILSNGAGTVTTPLGVSSDKVLSIQGVFNQNATSGLWYALPARNTTGNLIGVIAYVNASNDLVLEVLASNALWNGKDYKVIVVYEQ